jgi:hypothetical protein
MAREDLVGRSRQQVPHLRHFESVETVEAHARQIRSQGPPLVQRLDASGRRVPDARSRYSLTAGSDPGVECIKSVIVYLIVPLPG